MKATAKPPRTPRKNFSPVRCRTGHQRDAGLNLGAAREDSRLTNGQCGSAPLDSILATDETRMGQHRTLNTEHRTLNVDGKRIGHRRTA